MTKGIVGCTLYYSEYEIVFSTSMALLQNTLSAIILISYIEKQLNSQLPPHLLALSAIGYVLECFSNSVVSSKTFGEGLYYDLAAFSCLALITAILWLISRKDILQSSFSIRLCTRNHVTYRNELP